MQHIESRHLCQNVPRSNEAPPRSEKECEPCSILSQDIYVKMSDAIMKRSLAQKRSVKLGKEDTIMSQKSSGLALQSHFRYDSVKVGCSLANRVKSRRQTAPEYILFRNGNKQKIKNSFVQQNETLAAWYNNTWPDTPIVSSEAWNYCLLWLVSRFKQGFLIG